MTKIITSDRFVVPSGSSSSFLKGDGSLDNNVYALNSALHNAVTISATTNGLAINASQVLAIGLATTSANGALSSTDWNTFNNKQPALGYTPVNQTRLINTTSPLAGGGDLTADRTLTISQSNTSTNGYLSSTDWNTFNNKQPQINGTGFVKAVGTVISYDNSTYLTSESDTLQSVTNRGDTTSHNITANAFIKIAGSSSEFLKADGSSDSNTYLTSSSIIGKVDKTGDTMTGQLITPSVKIKTTGSGYTVSERTYDGGINNFLTVKNTKTDLPYSIFELQSTDINPLEATFSAMLQPTGVSTSYRFIDLSLLNYDNDPRCALVMQSRNSSIYPFRIAYDDGAGPYNQYQFNPDGSFKLLSEKLSNARRIEMGDYGSLQDYIRSYNTGLASSRATTLMFNGYMSNQTANTITAYNQFTDPIRIELNGDGDILFQRYFSALPSGKTFASSAMTTMAKMNGNGVTAIGFVKNGGTSSQYLMADGSVTTTVNDISKVAKTGDTMTGSLVVAITNNNALNITNSTLTASTIFARNIGGGDLLELSNGVVNQLRVSNAGNVTASKFTTSGGNTSDQWTTAFNERRQWDGGSTNLVASTGRASLGMTNIGSGLVTFAGVGSPRIPIADNTNNTSWIDYATFISSAGIQPVLTNPVTGTGTVNFIPKFNGTSTITNSSISDDGTKITTTESIFKGYISAGTTTTPVYEKIGIGGIYGTNEASISFGNAFNNSQGTYMKFSVNAHLTPSTVIDALKINSSGNIGVGTEATNKLHVSCGNVDGIRVESTNSAYIEVGGTSVSRWRWANDYTGANSLELLYGSAGATPTTSMMRIFSDGNIGINTTTNSSHKLNVIGGIRSSTYMYSDALYADNGIQWANNINTLGSNIDDNIYGGVYEDDSTVSSGTFPVESGSYSIIVERIGTLGTATQKATHIDSGRLFVREFDSISWTAWKEIINSDGGTFNGVIEAPTIVKTGGNYDQSLQADGSVLTLTKGSFSGGYTSSPAGLSPITVNNSVYSQIGDVVVANIGFSFNVTATTVQNYTITIPLPIARSASTQRFIGQAQFYGGLTVIGAVVDSTSTSSATIIMNKTVNGTETVKGNICLQYSPSI